MWSVRNSIHYLKKYKLVNVPIRNYIRYYQDKRMSFPYGVFAHNKIKINGYKISSNLLCFDIIR